jgi:hypothetical protein
MTELLRLGIPVKVNIDFGRKPKRPSGANGRWHGDPEISTR